MSNWERIAGPTFAVTLMLAGVCIALVETPVLLADAIGRLLDVKRARG